MDDLYTKTINPYRQAREDLGISQVRLSKLSGVTRTVILRTEQGMYSHPPVAIRSALHGEGAQIPSEQDYLVWQYEQRQLQSAWVNQSWDVPEFTSQHPLVVWRKAVCPVDSQMGFCRLLCVHPNSLRVYESGTQTTMPTMLRTALIQANFLQYAELERWASSE
jgi:hypothetical protein